MEPRALRDPLLGRGRSLVSWALYGAAAGDSILASPPNVVTWSSIGAAILVGIGGSAWLSAEMDKSILRRTAATAIQSHADPALAATINAGTPIQALSAALAARNSSAAVAKMPEAGPPPTGLAREDPAPPKTPI